MIRQHLNLSAGNGSWDTASGFGLLSVATSSTARTCFAKEQRRLCKNFRKAKQVQAGFSRTVDGQTAEPGSRTPWSLTKKGARQVRPLA